MAGSSDEATKAAGARGSGSARDAGSSTAGATRAASGSARKRADARPPAERTTDPAVGAVPPTEGGDLPSTQPSPGPETILREGEVVEGRFKVEKLLGAGGQGEVWRAQDLEIEGHVVALKLLFERARTPEHKEILLRELRMLASVSHPAVVQFKEFGWLGGRLWFVMPFLAGKSLEERMPITRAEARRVFETLAGGLAAVHAKGLRHQDIKPSNIFLMEVEGLEEPMPVLLDFGVAAKEGETLVAGSPDYFAPELAAAWPAPEHIGPSADVFSLALALRNALEPETAPTLDAFDPAALARRGSEPLPPPSRSDLRYLAPSFVRWLAVDPEARPSAAAFRAELEVLTAPEDRRAERARIARRVAPWVGLALVLVGLGSYWGWGELVAARKATAAEAALSEAARREAEEAETRAAALDSRLGEALGRADEASRRTEEALGRLDDAEAAIGRAEGSAEALRAARDRLRAALADARSEIAAQAAALGEAHESVARLGNDLARARADLTGARTDLEAARAEVSSREADLARVRSDLASAREDRAAREAELGAARARLTELEARVTSLEAQATRAEAAQASAEAARAAAESRAASLAARVGELEDQVRALRADLEEARRRRGGGGGSGGGDESPIVGGPIVEGPSVVVPGP